MDKKTLLFGATEHKVVPEALRHWVRILGMPFEVKAIPVDRNGQYSMRFLSAEIGRCYLICTMAVNNETGVIQQLDSIARCIAGETSPPLWLVDGVQALGKVAPGFQTRPIAYLALSGHKLHAPKGIGVLVARRSAPYHPLFVGGGQEQGRRSGTEALPALAGLSEVLRILLLKDQNKDQRRLNQGAPRPDAAAFVDASDLESYRYQIVRALQESFPGLSLNADPQHCVPTTINFSVPGMSGVEVWLLLESQGVFVSSGSACQSSKQGFSHVLEAMGLELWRLASATRLSFGLTCKESEVQMGCALISNAGQALRRSFGQAQSIVRVTNGIRSALVFFDQAREQAAFIGPVSDFSLRVGVIFSEVSRNTGKRIALDTVYDCSDAQGFLTSCFDSGAALFANEQTWRGQGNAGNAATCPNLTNWTFKSIGDGVLLCTPVSSGNVKGGIAGIVVFAHRDRVRQHNFALLDQKLSYIGLCCDEGRDSAGGIPFYIGHGKVCFVSDIATGAEAALVRADDIDQTLESVRKMGPDIRYIDVRERYEHEQQSPFAQVPEAIPGMFNLTHEVERQPLSEMIHFLLSEAQSGAAKDVPIVFMCRTGKRGFNAAALMRLFGWSLAFNLKGGAATIQTEIDSRSVS